MPSRPLVTCVVPAYNYGGYIGMAIDSALAQPEADELEIVVVDDGSTDDTPEVVRGYGDRVRYVRKENGGLNSTVDRGLAEARGEYVTLLDADDVWPENRLTPLLEVMETRPQVGLVYGEMNVIDKDGEVLYPSFLQGYGSAPSVGRAFGDLINKNTVSGGASLFRSSLAAVYRPIGPQAAYADWWLAVTIARVAELAFVPDVVNCYRMHGENMGLGRKDKTFEAMRDNEIKFRRWVLGSLKPGEATPAQVIRAHLTFETIVMKIARHYGVGPEVLVPVDADAAAKGATACERGHGALRRGDIAGAVCGFVNALAHDPFNQRARNGLALADACIAGAQESRALEGVRGFATLAFADELVADPALLAVYAERFCDDDDATLVVWAPEWTPDEAITRLSAAIEQVEAERELDADVLVEAGEAAREKRDVVAASIDAVLTRRPLPEFLSACPSFAPAGASELRDLAESRWLDAGARRTLRAA